MRRCFSRILLPSLFGGVTASFVLTCGLAPGYPVEPRRSMRGVTASFGVNLLCCGLHYFHAGAARPGGWVVTRSLVPKCVTKRLRHVRPHCGRTRAAVLVPIRPEDRAVGAAWDLIESVGLMREASRRGFARDRVLERSARRVFTRRSVALCGERRGVGWALPLDTIQVGMRGNAAGPV